MLLGLHSTVERLITSCSLEPPYCYLDSQNNVAYSAFGPAKYWLEAEVAFRVAPVKEFIDTEATVSTLSWLNKAAPLAIKTSVLESLCH